MSSGVLHFKSVNPLASRTLLLLHGAFSSNKEWELVCQTQRLSSFHLLIPDLPGHGRSVSASLPFNMPDTAALLADLVSKHAKDGKADLVGMSLGGYTSIYMAAKYPHLIGKGGLFLSGCGRPEYADCLTIWWPSPGSFKTWASGLVLFLSGWISTHLTKPLFDWICKNVGFQVTEDLFLDMKKASTYRLGQTLAQALAEDPMIHDKNWRDLSESVKVRACVVAGVLDDGEKDCRERGEQLRKGYSESKAFKVEGKRHAWDLQDPDLFARGIQSWMDHENLPEEYISLD